MCLLIINLINQLITYAHHVILGLRPSGGEFASNVDMKLGDSRKKCTFLTRLKIFNYVKKNTVA